MPALAADPAGNLFCAFGVTGAYQQPQGQLQARSTWAGSVSIWLRACPLAHERPCHPMMRAPVTDPWVSLLC